MNKPCPSSVVRGGEMYFKKKLGRNVNCNMMGYKLLLIACRSDYELPYRKVCPIR